MNKEVAFKSIDFFFNQAKDQNQTIGFIGGEPLLRFDLIKKVVFYAEKKARENKKKLSFSIITNGTIFSNEMVIFLKRHKFTVGISIDSYNQKINDSLRFDTGNKGTFKKIISSIKKFGPGDNLIIRPTLMGRNMDFLEYVKFFSRFPQVKGIDLGFLISNNRKYKLTLADAEKFRATMKKYEQYIFNKWKKGKTCPLLGVLKFIKQLQFFDYSKSKKPVSCDGGKTELNVSPTGEIYSCDCLIGDKEFMIGDIFTGINKKKYQTLLERTNIKNRPSCLKCKFKLPCAGRCYFVWKETEGSINKINPAICEMDKILFTTAENLLKKADTLGISYKFLLD